MQVIKAYQGDDTPVSFLYMNRLEGLLLPLLNKHICVMGPFRLIRSPTFDLHSSVMESDG